MQTTTGTTETLSSPSNNVSTSNVNFNESQSTLAQTTSTIFNNNNSSQSLVPSKIKEKKQYNGHQESLKQRTLNFLRRHLAFVGPGAVAAVAYIDPGNYASNLQAGASNGYSHLFVVLLSGIIAIVCQTMSSRLGIVTGIDLASHYRKSLYNSPNHPLLWRWGLLYPLYVICEGAIIFTDLAELLGSAIAINLLCPKIPIWGALLITFADVFIILIYFKNFPDSTATRAVRSFEFIVAICVFIVLAIFITLVAKVSPDPGDMFHGYIPSHGIIDDGGLYIAVAILGATVMPHSIFLGSKLATTDRTPTKDGTSILDPEAGINQINDEDTNDEIPQPNQSQRLNHIKQHLLHSTIDIALSLLFFAVVINSSILIFSSATFHYRPESIFGQGSGLEQVRDGDLFTAYRLLQVILGNAIAVLFAVALLISGQSASVTVTLAGQVVSEGFLNWTIKPWLRRLITRSIGIVIAAIVVFSAGNDGINTLLVASQVALSLVLPFVIWPLICFTSSPSLMTIPCTEKSTNSSDSDQEKDSNKTILKQKVSKLFSSIPSREILGYSFTNSPCLIFFSWSVWILIVIANVYALYLLGTGKG